MLLEIVERDLTTCTRKAHSIAADKDDDGKDIIVIVVVSNAGIRFPTLYTTSRFSKIQNLKTGEIYVEDGKWVKDPDKIYS